MLNGVIHNSDSETVSLLYRKFVSSVIISVLVISDTIYTTLYMTVHALHYVYIVNQTIIIGTTQHGSHSNVHQW